MSGKTAIEWATDVWNPVTGCSKVSPGCENCYAEKLSHRFGWTSKPWTAAHAKENVKLHPDRLDIPLRWKKPRMIFVNSMSDLFHEQVPFEFIFAVWARMAVARQHTFQVLTKRPQRMLDFFRWNDNKLGPRIEPYLPNVWLGVTVEDQRRADERIPSLLQTPAAVRLLSMEPLLGPVDLERHLNGGKTLDEWKARALSGVDPYGFRPPYPRIHWVIVGGESGHGARPMHPDWVRSIRDQCQASGVPFFFKQRGEFTWDNFDPYYGYGEDSGKWDEYICLNGERGFCKVNDPDGVWINWTGSPDETAVLIRRVGKKKAGRVLDGRTWDEMPKTGGVSDHANFR